MDFTLRKKISLDKFYIPILLSVLSGSLISFLLDRFSFIGTKIPQYGYYSTVIFTESAVDSFTYYFYFIFLLGKGLSYIGSFIFWVHMLSILN